VGREPVPCADGGAHLADLSTLEGETVTCVRCGARIVGDGPYEVGRWDDPDPPYDGILEASTLRWGIQDRISGEAVVASSRCSTFRRSRQDF
jgi:hypothetical protein